ncbi:MAG: DUF3592 domain-containing protein [Planctomycetaceae bacterium]
MAHQSLLLEAPNQTGFSGQIIEHTDGSVTLSSVPALKSIMSAAMILAGILAMIFLVPMFPALYGLFLIWLPVSITWLSILFISLLPFTVAAIHSIQYWNKQNSTSENQTPLVICSQKGDLWLRESDIMIEHDTPAFLEVVQDYCTEKPLNTRRSNKKNETNEVSPFLNHQMELNIIILQNDQYIRFPIIRQKFGNDVVRFAKLIAMKNDWSLIVKTGKDLPKRFLNKYIKALTADNSISLLKTIPIEFTDYFKTSAYLENAQSGDSEESNTRIGDDSGQKVNFRINTLLFICFLIGCGTAWWSTHEYHQAVDTKSWLETKGHILKSTVAVKSGRLGGKHYYPSILYRYKVNDKSYGGNQIQIINFSYSTRVKAEEQLKDFPKGMLTTAYYNPSDPTEAVLIHGQEERAWERIYFSLFLLVFPIVSTILIFVVKRIRKPIHASGISGRG